MTWLCAGMSAGLSSMPKWRMALHTQFAPVATHASSSRPPSPISNVKAGMPARAASTQRMPSATYMPAVPATTQPVPIASPSARDAAEAA